MNDWKRANTDWMHKARWGMMTHFLFELCDFEGATDESGRKFWCDWESGIRAGFIPKSSEKSAIEQWNRRVESVDVEALASRIADAGAGYWVLTVGQTSGFFCSPNAAYDRLLALEHSRLSRRDLIADVAAAMAKRNVRMIVYIPAGPSYQHPHAVEALGCTPEWDASGWGIKPGDYLRRHPVDERLSHYQRNWESVIREWSLRWGNLAAGWWVDGCYYADKMYRHEDAPNFRTFAEAMKAGNPDALVAFNTGVRVHSHTQYEDYTAGESNDLYTVVSPAAPFDRFMGGAQLHVMTFLGRFWCTGNPRFPDDLPALYTRHINGFGGVVTWDVPIGRDGTIRDAFWRQLDKIGIETRKDDTHETI
jgi:hypothetical protein